MTTGDYAIVEAERHHIAALIKTLRDEDAAEATSINVSPARAVWKSWRSSILRRAALRNGEVVAAWGLGGGLLSHVGEPWLMTSKGIEQVPVSFVREARREVRAMLDIRDTLTNFVPASYIRAIRFLEVLGFTVYEPLPLGPNGVPFRQFTLER